MFSCNQNFDYSYILLSWGQGVQSWFEQSDDKLLIPFALKPDWYINSKFFSIPDLHILVCISTLLSNELFSFCHVYRWNMMDVKMVASFCDLEYANTT